MADTPFPQKSTGPVHNTENRLYANADYKPILSNWFTAKPYGFRFTPKSGPNDAKVMYLPIGPSNLTITTHFATNIVPTIYGTVEEHSPVRYFDIVIEGTTGMTPKFVEPKKPNETPDTLPGRSSFSIQQSLSTLAGGFFAKTLGAVDKVVNDVTNIVGKSSTTGIQLDQTGYVAFHNLYRFFLKYKKNTSGTDVDSDGELDTTPRPTNAEHPLVFFNYKDNNEYNVVIRSFTLRRDKENPMLYLYSIAMRGYELKGLTESSGAKQTITQKESLEMLGLDGVNGSAFLTKAKEMASNARSILSSVANGANQLGR
jgi:hypothetical protein